MLIIILFFLKIIIIIAAKRAIIFKHLPVKKYVLFAASVWKVNFKVKHHRHLFSFMNIKV